MIKVYLANGADIVAEEIEDSETHVIVEHPMYINLLPNKNNQVEFNFAPITQFAPLKDFVHNRFPLTRAAILMEYPAGPDLSAQYEIARSGFRAQASGIVMPDSLSKIHHLRR